MTRKASEILTRLNELDCRVVQPITGSSGKVRFTVYRMTDLESIEAWTEIARDCKENLGATIDTNGVHSEANFRIWVPGENIEFDIEEGDQSIPTGYN